MGAVSRSVIRRRERIKRITALTMAAAFLVIVSSVGYLFYSRARTIAVMNAEFKQFEARKEELIQEHRALEELLRKKDDPLYIEYLARKELGLIKQGEEKYIILGGE